MCGRVIQSSEPLRLAIVEGLDVTDRRMGNVRPRYNAAPSQELLVIRENHKTGERSLDMIRGVCPSQVRRSKGWPRAHQRQGRDYRGASNVRRRICSATLHRAGGWLLRVAGEQRRKGQAAYVIAMNDGSPFGLAGIWENWHNPMTSEWERTFAIITVASNELVAH
jgi:putative SOS response-associated peptidase YedK